MNTPLQRQLATLQTQIIMATPAATSSNSQSITTHANIPTPAMITISQSNHSNNDNNNNKIPIFEHSSSVVSVEQVFEEYYEGLIDGPNGHRSWSLAKIEETYKTAWRQKEHVRKRYQR